MSRNRLGIQERRYFTGIESKNAEFRKILTFDGISFQVVNQSDPNWWQAKKVGWSGPAGLIPSQELEERRKAFVAPEADFVHKIGFCGTRVIFSSSVAVVQRGMIFNYLDCICRSLKRKRN